MSNNLVWTTEAIDATPSRILPKKEFNILYNKLDKNQKETIKTFLYESLKSCLLNAESRITIGHPHRYKYIMEWIKKINIPENLMYDQIPELSDEQVLLWINWTNRIFNPKKNFLKREDMYVFKINEVYIDSSRREKIAILQFLQNQESESDTVQEKIHSKFAELI